MSIDENLLDYAVSNGNQELLDMILKDFSSFTDKEKSSILFRVIVRAPSVDIVKHILGYGFDSSIKDENGCTLLHLAAGANNTDSVRFFIKEGLDVNAKNNYGETPLHFAAMYSGKTDNLKLLIDSGADMDATDADGESILIKASAQNSNPEIITFLLKNGCDIASRDKDGFTPLLKAAMWQSNSDVLGVLVDAGADINAKTKDGSSLVHLAARNENTEVARYIINSCITSTVNDAGFSGMDAVFLFGHSPDVVNLYLRKMREEHLIYASMNANPEILEALIKAGYDVNMTDSDGVSVLMYAAKFNTNPEIVNMLRYYNASRTSYDKNRRNILHYAAENENPAIYNWMLEDEEIKALRLSEQKDSAGNLPEYYCGHKDEF